VAGAEKKIESMRGGAAAIWIDAGLHLLYLIIVIVLWRS
jgi:hypothetical protein